MVVTINALYRWMVVGLLATPLGLAQAAETSAPNSALSDAWLATLQQAEHQQNEQRLAWSHAFALRHSTAGRLEHQRARLIHELEGIMLGTRAIGNAALTAGLNAWRSALQEVPALPGRTPGRHDLPWLGANLRFDPPLSDIRFWGQCEVPHWVEIWHHGGVSRLEWRSGMTLDQVLNALPDDAYRTTDQAVVIPPTGEQIPRGISAWNHQVTPLSPGGRIVLTLPTSAERSTTLPLSVHREAVLINQRLPEYLATRLPGDECVVW